MKGDLLQLCQDRRDMLAMLRFQAHAARAPGPYFVRDGRDYTIDLQFLPSCQAADFASTASTLESCTKRDAGSLRCALNWNLGD